VIFRSKKNLPTEISFELDYSVPTNPNKLEGPIPQSP